MFTIDPLQDDVKNQNKPGALCIVGFIGGPLRDVLTCDWLIYQPITVLIVW